MDDAVGRRRRPSAQYYEPRVADKQSRAALHLGSALMRIDSETSLALANLSDGTVQIELDQDTLKVRVRRLYV